MLELSIFVVNTFLAPLYKISHNSLWFSSIDVNFITNIKFKFFQSAWVSLVHIVFQSTSVVLKLWVVTHYVFHETYIMGVSQ